VYENTSGVRREITLKATNGSTKWLHEHLNSSTALTLKKEKQTMMTAAGSRSARERDHQGGDLMRVV